MKKEQSLLKTKIKELTPEVLAQLEKPLGTSDRPFPMWGSQRVEHNGTSDLQQVLSVIADDSNPMKVYSERPYKEVIALAYCDMPVPSMLPLFFDGLERRKPESTNRTQMMIGDPGHGKSFLGALQGRLRSKGPIEVFDCGGKNMNELLFEMVLDFGAGDALPTAIDKRLKAGSLEPMSLGFLKQIDDITLSKIKECRDFLDGKVKRQTADGKPIELTAPNIAAVKEEIKIYETMRVLRMEGGKILSIDWNGLNVAGNDTVAHSYEILSKISKIERLDNAGGNALGMNSQYGALVRAFLEGREIVLDEYNKSREGSDNALQTVWQFLIGEIPTCTVENPLKNKDAASGPGTFTFRREDVQAGFFVTLTGNKTEDGVTTRSLNKSVYSRLSPQTLPDPEVADWQHRICQMMVGLPVSTLYTVYKDQADKDPAGFGDWLLWLRKAKAEIEGVPVPALQEALLTNWQNVNRSSEKLARFYDQWSQMSNAEKIMQTNADLVEEVDEEYSKKEGIDFRKIKQHLEEAIPMRPRAQPYDAPVAASFGAWDKAPTLSEKVEENPALHFGTRLVEFLDRMVYEKTAAVGKEKLYNKLRKAMEQYGFRDVTLAEGERSKQKSVEEDLNISSFSDRDMGKQAAMARKVLCDYIRQVDPQIVEQDDDKIVTVKKVRDALETIGQKKTEETKELFVVNRDHETMLASPLVEARIEDLATYPEEPGVLEGEERQIEVPFSLEDLVSHDDFMAALALPTVSNKNISAIWEDNARLLVGDDTPSGGSSSADSTKDDEILLMAEGRSEKGLAMTTLRVLFADAAGERDVSVHVIQNSPRGKTLIVGEKVPSKLLVAFKEAGITHIDRNDPQAKAKVEAALNDLLRGMDETTKENLAGAFKYRNDIKSDLKKNIKRPLSELLIDGNIAPMYEKFVVKGPKKAA